MRIRLFLCFLFLWSTGTAAHSSFDSIDKEPAKATHIQLFLGESEESIKQRYPGQVKVRGTMNPDTASIEYILFEFEFEPPKLGSVQIQTGTSYLSFNHVYSVTGSEEWQIKKGISAFGIATGFNASQTIDDDQARLNMMSILKQLQAQGWRHHFSDDLPKLRGKKALLCVLKTGHGSLDPSYTPTLDEWMKIKDGLEWKLYLDQYYLSVSFIRKEDTTDLTLPDYAVIYRLTSATKAPN